VVASLFLAGRSLPATGSPRTYRGLYPYMLAVLVSGLIGFGVSQSDRLIAFFQTGLGNLAVYNIAAVGASVAAFAPIAVTNALVPILPSLGAAGSERRRAMMKNYTRYVSLVAMPAGFGLAAVSPLLLLVFGPQYAQGAPLVAVMAVAIGVTSIGSVYASGLLASGKTYLFLVGNALALICLVAISYVLIPVEGLLGIAIGRAGMLLVSLAAFALFSRTQKELVIDLRGYLSSLLSSVAMFAAIYASVYLASPHLATRTESVAFSLVMLPVGLAVFIVVMWLIDGFAEEDFVFLERLLPRFLTPLIELLRRVFLR
jgi:O-antigen/teichoic acid export membrane protein